MRRVQLGIALAMLTAAPAFAQTTSQATAPATSQGMSSGAMTSGTAAASGNDNQAVATTSANAPMPAHGHNSFTRGEAMRRIASRGYSNVQGLMKDSDGVWRGQASKDGSSTGVWLDYKGNVGTATSKE